MFLISHRGNLEGPGSCCENHPKSIEKVLNLSYDCEIDVWNFKGQYWLGHDNPMYKVDLEFLKQPNLWIHCKNLQALQSLKDITNAFYHNQDNYTLTSKGYIWTYPGKKICERSVIVKNKIGKITTNIAGVCSDYIKWY